ncbi:MAG: hypothetical protein DRO73_10875 [Candidatus Thorarchaeota archaeon]|nr:MAG: hypothetical protein DRO73_10875 [Candidatus Thorarchaeota archaeon]
MKSKLAVIFLGKPDGVAGWPYAQLNCSNRAEALLRPIRKAFPDVDFRESMVDSAETASCAAKMLTEQEIDGVVIWALASYHHDYSTEQLVSSGRPTILVSDLYGGDLLFLEVWDAAKRAKAPAIPISSSGTDELMHAINLMMVIHSLRDKKILVVEKSHRADDQSHFWRRSYDAYLKAAKERLGLDVLIIAPLELQDRYRSVDLAQAKRLAAQWTNDSLGIGDVDQVEIINAARLYLAMSDLIAREDAAGITIDCLELFYSGALPAYPCLGFFQLNSEGNLGVCEADLEATITQLLGQRLTGRPGFISDPVIDTGSSQIIYAHCVSHNCPLGRNGPCVPYKIRTHAEDRKGASVQVFLPPGYPLTTVKLNLLAGKLAIHSAESIGNVEEERACRTKLAAHAHTDQILRNWDFQTFGWHRVTFYGEFRSDFLDLASLLGLEVVEEDR